MHGKLSVNNLGTLMLGFNKAFWMVDLSYVAVTGVLTVTDDYIHCHRLCYSVTYLPWLGSLLQLG